MKKKVLLIFFFLFLIIFAPKISFSSSGKETLLGPIENVISLQEKIVQHRSKIEKAIVLAEPELKSEEIVKEIEKAIKEGRVKETILSKRKFLWMIVPSKRELKVEKNVRFEKLRGFVIVVFYKTEALHFFVTKDGNFGLWFKVEKRTFIT
jgi:hypothetical protein